MKLKQAYIKGIGMYVPKKVLTNHDLEKMVDTSDEWITTRTGIKERHIAAKNETSSTMGAEAAKEAIKNAGLKPKDIDLIITNTITPDMPFPNTSALIANILGIKKAGVFDIEAACSGFIYGLSIAKQYIRTGEYKNILVISSEVLSRVTDWEDRNTCVLFGDAAAAAVVSESSGKSEIISIYLGGDGAYGDLLYLPGGGSLHPATEATVKNRMHYMKMKGNETFKVAVTKMSESALTILEKANIKKSDVDLLIPHQANMRIIKMVQKTLELSDDKVYINLQKYGNTSAATIPVALYEAVQEGRLKRGDNLILVAFGGGFTWASAAIRW
ncbi:MAG: ketoacyl-ACP synthase III [Spirochaetes bacterium]|nr:ketoacyl-ACP synthase III [Spirochaetota bacterium]